jgi:hypothetical protein
MATIVTTEETAVGMAADTKAEAMAVKAGAAKAVAVAVALVVALVVAAAMMGMDGVVMAEATKVQVMRSGFQSGWRWWW